MLAFGYGVLVTVVMGLVGWYSSRRTGRTDRPLVYGLILLLTGLAYFISDRLGLNGKAGLTYALLLGAFMFFLLFLMNRYRRPR